MIISFRERASKERMTESLGERRDDEWSVGKVDSHAKEVGLTSDRKRKASSPEKGKE